MKKNAREVALETLIACSREGAWNEGALKKAIREAGLDSRDAALATQLCTGVLQNRMLCDFYIGCFSSVKVRKLEERVLEPLRLGVYQLLFLDKIPDRAAVSTSVELTRTYTKNPKAAGLVNGVLRNIARCRENLPEIPHETEAQALSIQYSHPQWLVEEWMALLGREEAESLLGIDNEKPLVTAQVNTLYTSCTALMQELEACGVLAQQHPWLPDCLLLSGTGDLEALPAWQEGAFYIQDAAARLAVHAAGLQPGWTVLDACAAPGGKSFAAAIAMQGKGRVISCDIHPHKLKLIEAGANRLKLSIEPPHLQSAAEYRGEWEEQFDAVIADVPCSGLGVIRKKPDIRYKDPKALDGLPAIQKKILENVSCYVKQGGVLLYSTCTLRPKENEAVIQAFLAQHPDFSLVPFSLPGPFENCTEGMLTLWPQRHGTDGFFIAKLQKRRG